MYYLSMIGGLGFRWCDDMETMTIEEFLLPRLGIKPINIHVHTADGEVLELKSATPSIETMAVENKSGVNLTFTGIGTIKLKPYELTPFDRYYKFRRRQVLKVCKRTPIKELVRIEHRLHDERSLGNYDYWETVFMYLGSKGVDVEDYE